MASAHCSNADETSAPTSHKRAKASILLSLSLVLAVPACSTLPKQVEQQTQNAFERDTSHTSLSKIIEPLRQQNIGLTGYHVLYDPLEALAARIQLIHKAEKSLDLQYYIWDNDKIGAMALHAIIQAADRGVHVRLLIDDNNAKKMEGIYLALDQHQNIDVKLYNPYRFRKYRPMDMVLNLKRINRRMHNKSFIADNQIALIGGRNMSNQYYNVSDNYQFSDVDVLLVGAASDEIIHSFDEYWNDEYAYQVKTIVNPQHYSLRFDSLKSQLEQYNHEASVQNYLDLANRSQNFNKWLDQNIQLDWVEAEVVKDSPSKIKSKAKKEEHLNFQLLQLLEKPEHSIDIVSAYFVPEKSGADRLIDVAKDNVQVRVLTNSYNANDVPLVHAFYAKYRQRLLENNVQLYEFLAAPEAKNLNENTQEIAEKAKVSMKGLSRSSLHAKLMAIDEKQVFIGSFNFDPRSAYLNSEIGVLLNSPALARTVHQTMDQNLSKFAYKLVLDANKSINWKIKKANDEIKTYPSEPKMKWYEKAAMKVIAWLPIEGFM
ncbi:phospholipase D family protein [Acinetobacter wanghuae]|uniref:Phospholipase D family protein n=1 Tax=Acinetobacter wanghuae TaxID=2662362 RepID=A0A5Q0P6N0_9GAMM|nr:phospholipase D family protein [Acinetobacter wanghuae]MQW91323.1 phospholipase D family protein [Acinetobacter wanghuae]QGA11771.1 phospholipase D family protein [Acinetobacter wanghuae]